MCVACNIFNVPCGNNENCSCHDVALFVAITDVLLSSYMYHQYVVFEK